MGAQTGRRGGPRTCIRGFPAGNTGRRGESDGGWSQDRGRQLFLGELGVGVTCGEAELSALLGAPGLGDAMSWQRGQAEEIKLNSWALGLLMRGRGAGTAALLPWTQTRWDARVLATRPPLCSSQVFVLLSASCPRFLSQVSLPNTKVAPFTPSHLSGVFSSLDSS